VPAGVPVDPPPELLPLLLELDDPLPLPLPEPEDALDPPPPPQACSVMALISNNTGNAL